VFRPSESQRVLAAAGAAEAVKRKKDAVVWNPERALLGLKAILAEVYGEPRSNG
jgi:hypothetical protein